MENISETTEGQAEELLTKEPTDLVPATDSVAGDPEVLDADSDADSDAEFIPDTQPMVSVESDALPKIDSNEVRKRVLEVKDEIDAGCVEMCALIRTIQVKQLWMNWGFPSLREYCEQELGMKRSKALYFAQAYKFAEREGIESFKTVMSLGWTKGVQLIRVATTETLTQWIEKGKLLSVDSLTREVQKFIADKIPDDPKEALDKAPEVENTQMEEETKTMTLTFPQDSFLSVSQALEMVSVQHPGLQKGEALGLIAGEFAASNSLTEEETVEAKTNSKMAGLRQMIRIANLSGIRFIALDPDTGDFMHGYDDFKELVEKVLEPQEAPTEDPEGL